MLTFSHFVLKYSGIQEKTMRKPSIVKAFSERGTVKALRQKLCQPLVASPGRTGTGAPVTERLRCLHFAGELGWYRDICRPYVFRGGFFIL